MADGKYKLLDPKPIEPGEPESIPRAPRRKRSGSAGPRSRAAGGQRSGPTYSEVGRTAVDKLIELGREVGTLRGTLRTLREEAREAREAKDEAERRSASQAARIRDLEGRVEMAESNLRTILTAARGGQRRDAVHGHAVRPNLARERLQPPDEAGADRIRESEMSGRLFRRGPVLRSAGGWL